MADYTPRSTAGVDVVHLTARELRMRKVELDVHIRQCCAAQEGTCRRLEELGEVEFLLGKEAGRRGRRVASDGD